MTEIEKLKKEIEDLKQIIESKNNKLNLKISILKDLRESSQNIKRIIPVVTEGAELPPTRHNQNSKTSLPDYKAPFDFFRSSRAIPNGWRNNH